VSDLIRLPFPEFLAAVAARFPVECRMMLGEADVSPESAAAGRHPGSWAYRLFHAAEVTDHREFDRAALGLKYLHAAFNGDRAAFPVSDASYGRVRDWVARSLAREEDVLAWTWALLFNDLGKLKVSSRRHAEIFPGGSADHDRVMVGLLCSDPGFYPSFADLSPEYRDALIFGLDTGFNLGKAAQLECPPAAWDAVAALSPFAANFHFGHSFFDFLGVTGAVDPDAAKPFILNDDNVEAYLGVIDSRDPAAYAARRLALAAVEAADATEAAALARVVGMSRVFDAEGGRRTKATWDALPPQVRAILTGELSLTGRDSLAIEPHYGPALLANAAKADPAAGQAKALTAMAEALFHARLRYRGTDRRGVAIANLADLAAAFAKDGPAAADRATLDFAETDDGLRLVLRSRAGAAAAAPLGVAGLLPGERAAFVGIGGGSDCLQAACLALESGADTACVISVRTAVTASEGASGKTGEERAVQGHGGEVAPGVWRVLPDSTGSGRFLENLPAAAGLRSYLVLDAQDGSLAGRLRAALSDAGSPRHVVAVDTGGDALYRTASDDAVRATPDQDLRVLVALSRLEGVRVLSVELAVGVDAPDYAEEVLAAAGARALSFPAPAAARVLARYADWRARVPGGWLGKTPLAWTAALSGARGLAVLDIPAERVTDARNPWNPFVRVDDAMSGGFVMELADHLAALGIR
jgi:hypothetical protein